MQFTKATGYGILGMLHLASITNSNGKSNEAYVAEIARAREIPHSFLAKIFQNLSRAGLVRSHRGARGGFSLARPSQEITVREIIEAIEGPVVIFHCLSSEGHCPKQDNCNLYPMWKEAQDQMLKTLSSYTLKDLVKNGHKDVCSGCGK